VDVHARPGDECLYAEEKGRPMAFGLDVDTLCGQLLCRIADPGPGTNYAVVVPKVADDVHLARCEGRRSCARCITPARHTVVCLQW
jgi:hypothetical protein